VNDDFDGLVRELELAAERLRTGELDPREASELVERCAELAAQVGSELDRRARDVEGGVSDQGQERLL